LAQCLCIDAPEADQNELHHNRMTPILASAHQFPPEWKEPAGFGGKTECS